MKPRRVGRSQSHLSKESIRLLALRMKYSPDLRPTHLYLKFRSAIALERVPLQNR